MVSSNAFGVAYLDQLQKIKYIKCRIQNIFIILLHTDPSIERPHKLKPVQTVEDRKEILHAIKYVDDVIRYTYEESLYDLLKVGEFDIRFLGDDYKNKPFTGDDLKIPICYLDRSHGWSTTKFKKLIYEAEHNTRK